LYLTEEKAAALLRELNGMIDGDRYFLSPRIKDPEGNPCQNETGAAEGVSPFGGAGARAVTAAEAVRSPTGLRQRCPRVTILVQACHNGDMRHVLPSCGGRSDINLAATGAVSRSVEPGALVPYSSGFQSVL